MNKLSLDEKYGKRRQVTFRIGPIAQEKLAEMAKLFRMKPPQYVKAILYKDLGVFCESLDQRRRDQKRRK